MFHIVPRNINFDFLGKQRTFAMVSAFFIVACLAGTLIVGPNYGIDFRGGSDIILDFEGGVTADEVRQAAADAGLPKASVQSFGPAEKNQFMVQTIAVSVVDEAKAQELIKALEAVGESERVTWNPEQPDRLDAVYKSTVTVEGLKKAVEAAGLENVEIETAGVEDEPRYVIRFQDLGQRIRKGFKTSMGDKFDEEKGLERLVTVGPRVGAQLKNAGILSLLVAILLILIYIAFRFDVRYAPGAVAALVHDVIIAVGIFTFIQMEFSLPIIAALLTIVGYSLNDTIVVFDRIRENLVDEGDADVPGTVNRSINETLSRTLITSITTLLAVLAIFMFGGGLIRDFAFALIVGIIIGTYSSVFVASPVMLMMDSYIRTRRASQKVAAQA